MVFVLLYVCLAASLFFVHDILYHLAVAGIVSFSLLFLPFRQVKGGILPIALFLSFTFGGNLFFHSGKILYGAGFFSITDEGLLIANIRTLRVFSMIYGAKILTHLLSVEEMIRVIGRIFGPLEKIGVPATEFFSIMGSTLKSFPILTSRLTKAYREDRGCREIQGFRSRVKHLVTFMLPLFIDSIHSPEKFFIDEESTSPQRRAGRVLND